jgi:hypothetical protein
VSLFGGGPGEPELPVPDAVRSPARAFETRCSADDHGVADKQLARADAIGAWVCAIGIVAAVLLVLVLAARS